MTTEKSLADPFALLSAGKNDKKNKEVIKFQNKYNIEYQDARRMRDAYKLIQCRKGQISKKNYDDWKKKEKKILDQKAGPDLIDLALGSKLPGFLEKIEQKVNLNQKRFEKMTYLGKSLEDQMLEKDNMRECCRKKQEAKFKGTKNQQEIGKIIWDYKNEFEQIDRNLEEGESTGQRNPLLNVNSVKEYVNTSFEESTLIKNRSMHIKKMNFIKKNLNTEIKQKQEITEPKKPMSFQQMYNQNQRKIKEQMKTQILNQFMKNKGSSLKIDLPFEKESLYKDLKKVYYGDLFFNSPKSELERLQDKKSLLKIQRSFSSNKGQDILMFPQNDKVKMQQLKLDRQDVIKIDENSSNNSDEREKIIQQARRSSRRPLKIHEKNIYDKVKEVEKNIKRSPLGRDIEKIDKFLFVTEILDFAEKKSFGPNFKQEEKIQNNIRNFKIERAQSNLTIFTGKLPTITSPLETPKISNQKPQSKKKLRHDEKPGKKQMVKIDYSTSNVAYKEKLAQIRSSYTIYNQAGLTNSDIPVPFNVSEPPTNNYISPKLYLYLNKDGNNVSQSYEFNRRFARRNEMQENKLKEENEGPLSEMATNSVNESSRDGSLDSCDTAQIIMGLKDLIKN